MKLRDGGGARAGLQAAAHGLGAAFFVGAGHQAEVGGIRQKPRCGLTLCGKCGL